MKKSSPCEVVRWANASVSVNCSLGFEPLGIKKLRTDN